jgi:hypothetical protein
MDKTLFISYHSPSRHAGQEQEGSQILITVPPHLLETIELYAMHMGVTHGEAIRDLLNRGLDSIDTPL